MAKRTPGMNSAIYGPEDDDWPTCSVRTCSLGVSYRLPKFDLCQQHLLEAWYLVQADMNKQQAEADHKAAKILEAVAGHAAQYPMPPWPANPGTIYYLRIGAEYKIGWTKNLWSRLDAYPPTAQVLATEPGTMKDEQAIHRRFAKYRAGRKEWYRRASVITRHIQKVAEIHGAEDPRDPIVTLPKTPQERQAESMRWDGKGQRRIS